MSRAAVEPTVVLVPFIGSQAAALVGRPTFGASLNAYGTGAIWPTR